MKRLFALVRKVARLCKRIVLFIIYMPRSVFLGLSNWKSSLINDINNSDYMVYRNFFSKLKTSCEPDVEPQLVVINNNSILLDNKSMCSVSKVYFINYSGVHPSNNIFTEHGIDFYTFDPLLIPDKNNDDKIHIMRLGIYPGDKKDIASFHDYYCITLEEAIDLFSEPSDQLAIFIDSDSSKHFTIDDKLTTLARFSVLYLHFSNLTQKEEAKRFCAIMSFFFKTHDLLFHKFNCADNTVYWHKKAVTDSLDITLVRKE